MIVQDVLSRTETTICKVEKPVAPPVAEVGSSTTSSQASTGAAEDVVVLDSTVPLTLHVSGINSRTKKCHVEAWLLEVVEILELVEVRLIEDKDKPGQHKGFGFIELRTSEASAKVLALSGSDLLGSVITVRTARPKHEKDSHGGLSARRFGSVDYTALAIQVDKHDKKRIAEQVAKGEKDRADFLAMKARKEEEQRKFVAAGGRLPGGFGHGFAANGQPLLHSGYSRFEL